MPVLRMRHDLGIGEAAHLRADRLEGLVQAGIADRARMGVRDQRREPGAGLDRVAGRDQLLDRAGPQGGDLRFLQPEIAWADDLALVHRDPAEDLREIFAKADARHQRLGLAEPSLGLHPAGIAAKLLDRLDIGREPGEAVGGVLLALDRGGAQPAVLAQPQAQRGGGARKQGLDGVLGLEGEFIQAQGGSPKIAFIAPQHASSPRLWQCPFGRGGAMRHKGLIPPHPLGFCAPNAS